MDAGVQEEGSKNSTTADSCPPVRANYRDLDGEETPEQRLERQKNALLTMISVRELKALLSELEGGRPMQFVKEERHPKRNPQPRGIRRSGDRVAPNAAKRRSGSTKIQPTIPRITTFCFNKLEIGEFRLTAPDERCAVVPGTNWVKVDADQRLIIYQFIIASNGASTPFNVSVHVSFASISAIFCGLPEIIIKLNQPAVQASCYQTFGGSYHIVPNLDVTEGQLASALVHTMTLRHTNVHSFSEVLMAADPRLFSSIISNGHHLSASSSHYPTYGYHQPNGILSDYGPSIQHSSYMGGGRMGVGNMNPMPMGSSLVPHHTYSTPIMNMGAGRGQLENQTRESGGGLHLTQMQPLQQDRVDDEGGFGEIFDRGDMMRTKNEVMGQHEGMKMMSGSMNLASPASTNSIYVSPIMNQTGYTERPMTSCDSFVDDVSSSLPRTVSSSLYALSGSPIYPPPSSTPIPPPTALSGQHTIPTPSSTISPPSAYPFPSPSSLITPSPLLSTLSPFFNFASISTPTSLSSPAFWNSLKLGDEFEAISRSNLEPYPTDKTDNMAVNGDGELNGNAARKDSLEELEMIPKEEESEMNHRHHEHQPSSSSSSAAILHGDDVDLMEDNDDDRVKFAPSEYSFSSLNFDNV